MGVPPRDAEAHSQKLQCQLDFVALYCFFHRARSSASTDGVREHGYLVHLAHNVQYCIYHLSPSWPNCRLLKETLVGPITVCLLPWLAG